MAVSSEFIRTTINSMLIRMMLALLPIMMWLLRLAARLKGRWCISSLVLWRLTLNAWFVPKIVTWVPKLVLANAFPRPTNFGANVLDVPKIVGSILASKLVSVLQKQFPGRGSASSAKKTNPLTDRQGSVNAFQMLCCFRVGAFCVLKMHVNLKEDVYAIQAIIWLVGFAVCAVIMLFMMAGVVCAPRAMKEMALLADNRPAPLWGPLQLRHLPAVELLRYPLLWQIDMMMNLTSSI